MAFGRNFDDAFGDGAGAALFCGLLVGGIGGGTAMEKLGEKHHVEVPTIAPLPEDVSTIEGIVKASYETISGGAGVPRQWGRDRTLVCAERAIHFPFEE